MLVTVAARLSHLFRAAARQLSAARESGIGLAAAVVSLSSVHTWSKQALKYTRLHDHSGNGV